ncbi:MAG TPA: hypothetical protein PK079_07925 [Leptospiraceae bacterium]|nr:hypothetical protein [Leptospiraceae bacterium]HMW07386.1 hypothetical protein [Leptospiraceae bacterium]HMX34237.1 hypothetical protein [Leptospiraceae bacterium]HMY32450.1 hypothetical protein [Leptospiraceae bacterium]HMZ64205.1 hypothetical protein [Leptospiraceae bacterium]
MKEKNWIYNQSFDLVFILSPPFLSIGFIYLFSDLFLDTVKMPLWIWVSFILCIDVSHVYSTLFRTYFNPKEFQENKTLLTLLPIGLFFLGVILHLIDSKLFWRVLAYSAVFHFIRQQYGFLRFYSKDSFGFSKKLEAVLLYSSTLYPVIYWHANLPRNFHWFVDGDFLIGLPLWVERISFYFYLGIIGIYLLKELKEIITKKYFSIGKNLLLLGTALSWYFGIVYFNQDIVFTITNVVTHGIPYIALIWVYGNKEAHNTNSPLLLNRFSYKVFFTKFTFPMFILTLFLFAYIEEGFWAGFIWREHLEFFKPFISLPTIRSKETLSILVTLLTLPQATHYVLDGFIWKLRDRDSYWYTVLFK